MTKPLKKMEIEMKTMQEMTPAEENTSSEADRPVFAWGSQAALDVLAERRRQIEAEGWTPEHDDEHVNDEIAALACFYAMPPGAREWDGPDTYASTLGDAMLPDGWHAKTGDRRRELVKAGALILAEIERLDRAEAAKTQPSTSD